MFKLSGGGVIKFLMLPFFLIMWVIGLIDMHMRFGFAAGGHFGTHLHGLCRACSKEGNQQSDKTVDEALRGALNKAGVELCNDPACKIDVPHLHAQQPDED